MADRVLSPRDRAFLARHRQLADHPERGVTGGAAMIEISGEVIEAKGAAVKFFDGSRTEWVPSSQITDLGDGVFLMPEWMAKRKGFI